MVRNSRALIWSAPAADSFGGRLPAAARRAAAPTTASPVLHGTADLSLQLAAEQQQLGLLLDRQDLLQRMERVLRDERELLIEGVAAGDQRGQLGGVGWLLDERPTQLLLQGLALLEQLLAVLIRLADHAADLER